MECDYRTLRVECGPYKQRAGAIQARKDNPGAAFSRNLPTNTIPRAWRKSGSGHLNVDDTRNRLNSTRDLRR